ncbi:MAG: tol-pal system protein YbgF, partial [Candidatus Acidiferrales bacterium]
MRTREIVLALGILLLGGIGGTLLSPAPVGAVSREMIELQQSVDQLVQGQQTLRSAIDANNAAQQVLVKQTLDAVSQLNSQMGVLQKAVGEVQANTGARIDTMTTQTQGVSDNVQDVQARVAKLSQQMTDMQNLLQSIDAKVSGSAPPQSAAPGTGTQPSANPGAGNYPQPTGASPAGANTVPSGAGAGSPSGMPPISSTTLYDNALRDFTSGNYDLARQEFTDYIRNFPSSDLAGNAQFYLGEMDFAQNKYKESIAEYDVVLNSYPNSFKLAASLLRRADAETKLGLKASAIRDLREVIRRFPGTDEARRAQA